MSQINLSLLTELEAKKKEVNQAVRNELERVFPHNSTVFVFLSSKQKIPSEALIKSDYRGGYQANGYITVYLVGAKKYRAIRDVHFTNIQKNSKERS